MPAKKETILLFDINETVLDLRSLRPKFQAVFADEGLTDTWFAMLLHASTVSVVTALRTDFATLAKVVLEALAAKRGVSLSAGQVSDLLGAFASLPPHDDIKPALTRLQAAGFRCIAFSNSSRELISKQITNAGLSDYFDELISVEQAGTFKPDHKAYHFAATQLQSEPAHLRLIAAHDWDTHGAVSAGLKAAYVNRFQTLYNPLFRETDITGTGMVDVADRIIATDA